ncbi:L-xylulokinase [Jannaschia faecimaris]|uniref:L-xylulokinase n=1 Tax=Jannaschia faecimaris TaxID=1244108 RepID=A0A1H3P599_9RHOB|nr:FGGY-family carbohydrate kinase [Jannaschia faecimaris]SDY96231.1 L-xylulokinase [Jannaschia faecimaris]
MPLLLGIDSGLTVTKAVLFDETGQEVAVARRRLPQSIPEAHHVERDMVGLWSATCDAIAEALDACGRPASDVIGIAATAHGDGLYLLDRSAQPLGPGILSLDSRAQGVVDRWQADGLFHDALDLTGQVPHASAPSAILAHIRDTDPDRFAAIGHVLSCKDWLRTCLTGTIGTDRTEASTAFTDVETQNYTQAALALYGLAELTHALPAMADSDAFVGHVTKAAAARTGLVAGTPVMAGLHDVTASGLGIGGQRAGAVDVVAGTYSINEMVTDAPTRGAAWFCRNGIRAGQWNAMSISPTSTTNYDWFIGTFCQGEPSPGLHDRLAKDLSRALDRPSSVLFHPYLFGSPFGAGASGSLTGLQGWHDRSDVLRAVLEGIAFTHRHHIDALRGVGPFDLMRLTGGVSRNPRFAQLMADVTGLRVVVSATGEAAAWGAALCAGSGAGLWSTPFDDPRDLPALSRAFEPDPSRVARNEYRYATFCGVADALAPIWPDLQRLGAAP